MAMRISFLIASSLALAACGSHGGEATTNETAGPAADAGIKGVHRDFRGKAEPSVVFSDAEGKPVTLKDFRGKPVLVNLWASWCAPCVKELPTLNQLARTGTLKVIAVSQDTGPRASVVAFLKDHRIDALRPYQDSAMGLSGALGPDTVLPTSILFDSNGREVWRFIGDQDWTSAQAASLLSEPGAAAKQG